MLDALQLLSGVLGMEFLINFTMPCLRHKDSDQVQLARLIGQLHYSACTAGTVALVVALARMHAASPMLSAGAMTGALCNPSHPLRLAPPFAVFP